MSHHEEEEDVDVIGDEEGEGAEQLNAKDIEELLLKYYHPLDDEGYRKCKLCEDIPPGQRRGNGAVVSFMIKRSLTNIIHFCFVFRKSDDRKHLISSDTLRRFTV